MNAPQGIRQFLNKTTSAAIKEAVIQVLQSIRHGTDLQMDDSNLKDLAHEQVALGQRATLNGMWHVGLNKEIDSIFQDLPNLRLLPEVTQISSSLEKRERKNID